MGFGEAISSGFANYVNFTDRAVRSEYWFWALFTILAGIGASIIDTALGGGPMQGGVGIVSMVLNLALLVPSLAVGVRRLHDLDRSGWWLFIGLIPLIGAIILIVWFCTRGTPGPNRFGGSREMALSAVAQRM